MQKDANGKNLKIRKCENVQVVEKFENRTIPKKAHDKKIENVCNWENQGKLRIGQFQKKQRGSPLYKLFGAGWGQKGVGGLFLKIRPHSCV